MKKSLLPKLALGLLLLAAIGWSLASVGQLKDNLASFMERTQELGPLGMLMFVGFYILATVLFLPGSPITLGAGFVFGPVVGTALVSVGSVAGASAAFLLGRTLLRGAIESKVAANERFVAIDQAVGREGFKIVLLTRLSPVFPYNLLNYSFGLTQVRFRDYVLASWIGMLPATFMYVYFGSAVKNVADVLAGNIEGGLGQKVFFGVGLVAAVVVTIFVTRVARKALQGAIPTADSPEAGD